MFGVSLQLPIGLALQQVQATNCGNHSLHYTHSTFLNMCQPVGDLLALIHHCIITEVFFTVLKLSTFALVVNMGYFHISFLA
jgi:hypothetical protein